MTATDLVGSLIDGWLERRYGAPYSPTWWQRRHDSGHHAYVELACPHCPDAAELGRRIYEGPMPPPMSYNDWRASAEAYWQRRNAA